MSPALSRIARSPAVGFCGAFLLVLWEAFWLIGPPLDVVDHINYLIWGGVALIVCFGQALYGQHVIIVALKQSNFKMEPDLTKSQYSIWQRGDHPDGTPMFVLEMSLFVRPMNGDNEKRVVHDATVCLFKKTWLGAKESKVGTSFFKGIYADKSVSMIFREGRTIDVQASSIGTGEWFMYAVTLPKGASTLQHHFVRFGFHVLGLAEPVDFKLPIDCVKPHQHCGWLPEDESASN